MECWFRGTVSLRGRSHLPSRRGPSIAGSDFQDSGFFLLLGELTASPLKFVQVIDLGGIVKTCSTLISLKVRECLLKLSESFVVSKIRSPR